MYEALITNFSTYATLVLTKVNFLLEAKSLIAFDVASIVLVVALLTATIARKKDGSYFKWFVAGALFGFIALPMAILKKQPVAAPPRLKQCPNCPEQVPISILVCESCDYNFLSEMVGHRHKLLPYYQPLAADSPNRTYAYGS